jgi:exodeoxyribonuclease VII large subunit
MQREQHVYEVSELNREIKRLLEESFPFVWISGEISNFRKPASGHCYFTLKDDRSQIGCVMFRSQANALKFNIEDGIHVIGLGRVALYEPRGTYQIIFEYMDPKGVGALQIAFDKLKKKLFDEGLFDERHKKSLPFLPQKVSIITSPSGAAIRDFIKVAHRRFPNLSVEIVGVRVQGDYASTEMIDAINYLNLKRNTDLIVLARGGGSIEDLSVFNDERLARAIFSSNLPVVSAVGHETDFTIADFVADLRAPTPSAAAEIVIPMRSELEHQARYFQEKLEKCMGTYLKLRRKDLEGLRYRIVHPKRRIEDAQMRLDDLCHRLETLVSSILVRKKERLHQNRFLLTSFSPGRNIKNLKKQVAAETYLLNTRMKQKIKEGRSSVSNCKSRLEVLSPLSVLKRGYSITRTLPNLEIIRDSKDVELEQSVDILLGGGQLQAKVYGKEPS